MGPRLLLPLLVATVLHAEADANRLIQRLLDAQKLNQDRIQPYTYVEQSTHYTYGKNGKLKTDYTETRDIVFLEGLPFRKLVARNGKPLPPKERAAIEQIARQTAEERRRKMARAPAGGQLVMGDQTIDLGSNEELLTLYENRIAGEEEIGGRKTWLVESEPRAGYTPKSPHEFELLSFRRKLWIDQQDMLPVRVLFTVSGPGIHFAQPGSTIQVEYTKIAPEVWCQASFTIDIWRQAGGVARPWKRTEYVSGNFQKFDVQSTVTVIQR